MLPLTDSPNAPLSEPLSENERQLLLRVARSALEAAFLARPEPSVSEISGRLAQRRGAFVTLRRFRVLRGCVGRIESPVPLVPTIRECALGAALDDPRFLPVTGPEVPKLNIEISVLSSLFDVSPEDIEIGRHGLFMSFGSRHGLLLPQVPLEWNWDRGKFLQETCLKAGMSPDAWRQGARIQAFTAQVFGEQKAKERAQASFK